MIPRIRSFAVTPGPSRPSTRISSVFGLRLPQALRGEHVLDLAGADAEGERAERAVSGGMAVAAYDGHSRLGEAQLGTDDVHDALFGRAKVEKAHAELAAVAAHHLDLRP